MAASENVENLLTRPVPTGKENEVFKTPGEGVAEVTVGLPKIELPKRDFRFDYNPELKRLPFERNDY